MFSQIDVRHFSQVDMSGVCIMTGVDSEGTSIGWAKPQRKFVLTIPREQKTSAVELQPFLTQLREKIDAVCPKIIKAQEEAKQAIEMVQLDPFSNASEEMSDGWINVSDARELAVVKRKVLDSLKREFNESVSLFDQIKETLQQLSQFERESKATEAWCAGVIDMKQFTSTIVEKEREAQATELKNLLDFCGPDHKHLSEFIPALSAALPSVDSGVSYLLAPKEKVASCEWPTDEEGLDF